MPSASSSSSTLNETSIDVADRSTASTSTTSSRGILFPDENGNFNIPKVAPPGISNRWANEWLQHEKKVKLFPRPPVCGPMLVGDKIHGGVEAQLGEFPWLANLEYRNGELKKFV